jgi:hypothetical protein
MIKFKILLTLVVLVCINAYALAEIYLKNSSQALLISNDSEKKFSQIIIGNQLKKYFIGSFSVQDIIFSIYESNSSIKSDPYPIFNYIASSFDQFCSNGSYYEYVRSRESVLNRIYSYSFGCCSDVNEPIAATFYNVAGYYVMQVFSNFHTALQICSDKSKLDTCYYVDPDHNRIINGTIFELRKRESEKDKTGYWFGLGNLLGKGGTLNIHENSLDDLVSFTPSLNQVKDINFNLYPGDSIEFLRISTGLQTIYSRTPDDEQSMVNKFNYSNLGKLKINLNNYAYLFEYDYLENLYCRYFHFTSPYVFINNILKIGDIEIALKTDSLFLSHLLLKNNNFSYKYNHLFSTKALYELNLKLCMEFDKHLMNPRIESTFQYNAKVFPWDIESIEILSQK